MQTYICNSIGTYTTTTANLPSMISLPLVCLSSASNMYLASSSKAADLITRECLVPSLMSSNLSSPVISWVPFSQRKVLGSLDTSHSNLASSFSKTLTSLSGVMKMSGSSEREAGAEPVRAGQSRSEPAASTPPAPFPSKEACTENVRRSLCTERTFHFQISCRFSIGSLEGNLPSHIQLAVIKNQDMFLPVLDDFTVLGRAIIDRVYIYRTSCKSPRNCTLGE